MGALSHFFARLTGREKNISKLAEQLHLRNLPEKVAADEPARLAVSLWDRYDIEYIPRIADGEEDGRQSAKKAFEIAVVARDTGTDSVSVIYVEEAPDYYRVQKVKMKADCPHLRDMMKDTDYTVQEVMKTIERYLPVQQRCEF